MYETELPEVVSIFTFTFMSFDPKQIHGVVEIVPKLLQEIVEQISIPLATVFNLSLEEGIVPLKWKEANITPLFKKGFEKQVGELQTCQFNIGDLQIIRETN